MNDQRRNTMAYLVAVAAHARNPNPTNDQSKQSPVAGRPPVTACVQCREVYKPTRSDSRFCSNKCRQAAYRQRRTNGDSV